MIKFWNRAVPSAAENGMSFVKRLLECFWALAMAECLTMQNQRTTHLELPIMIWVLSEPQSSGAPRSKPACAGRGASELRKKMIGAKHTKGVRVSSYDPHSQRTSMRPSAYTYVQVENL